MSSTDHIGPREEGEAFPKGKTHDLNTRFFRYFQQELTALQEQIESLGSTALVSGERSDAEDHCLAGISRLSSEVQDASSYIPMYDQRVYAEAIKALQDKLGETKEIITPRPRFTFKTARKNPSAISLNEAAELEAEGRRHASESSTELPKTTAAANNASAYPEVSTKDDENNVNGSRKQGSASEVSEVTVNEQKGRHITLPMSEAVVKVPASVTSVQECVVDLFISAQDMRPFAGLSIKDVSKSLLLCGQVNGAAHITNMSDSVIVISCHQFRMHHCKNVDIYLSCTSKPIIEDCSGVRFSKIPNAYATNPSSGSSSDLWSHIEDFNWLKTEPSPNWKLLDQADAVKEDVWEDIVSQGAQRSLHDLLRDTRVIQD